ncbi:MAG: NAD(P)/FAD-dependent oxidoreductase [Lachnospiraceae bacterium]|nr:NAD(P)/FAD-dependent oxidoreductase [Lachnospiraceae bacterium]
MNIAIIGGGAAGMMAAIKALENGNNVTLYDKNDRPGKKLYITGKGRCNITNDASRDEFFDNVLGNNKFLYSAFNAFSNQDMIDFIEGLGCPVKVERGGRVFPVSDKSSDVIKALKNRLQELGCNFKFNSDVKEIIPCNEGFDIVTDNDRMSYEKVVITTGGNSYPITGSNGDGYKLLKKLGHSITDIRPALVPMNSSDYFIKDLQGLTLKNVRLSMLVDGKQKYEEMGEMLFTHFGISGPLVLSASSVLAHVKEYKTVKCIIDLKPALSVEQLDERLIREFKEGNLKNINNVIPNLYPHSLCPVMLRLSNLDPYKKCNVISKEERQRLVNVTKKFEIKIDSVRDFNEAIITKGGVNLKEINPKTMESKNVPGLYLAGEVIDLDAFTGGFNLQIAWSTGYLAGMSL